MSQQLRILYGNLPRYYNNHPDKKKIFFDLINEETKKISIFLGDKEIGVIER